MYHGPIPKQVPQNTQTLDINSIKETLGQKIHHSIHHSITKPPYSISSIAASSLNPDLKLKQDKVFSRDHDNTLDVYVTCLDRLEKSSLEQDTIQYFFAKKGNMTSRRVCILLSDPNNHAPKNHDHKKHLTALFITLKRPDYKAIEILATSKEEGLKEELEKNLTDSPRIKAAHEVFKTLYSDIEIQFLGTPTEYSAEFQKTLKETWSYAYNVNIENALKPPIFLPERDYERSFAEYLLFILKFGNSLPHLLSGTAVFSGPSPAPLSRQPHTPHKSNSFSPYRNLFIHFCSQLSQKFSETSFSIIPQLTLDTLRYRILNLKLNLSLEDDLNDDLNDSDLGLGLGLKTPSAADTKYTDEHVKQRNAQKSSAGQTNFGKENQERKLSRESEEHKILSDISAQQKKSATGLSEEKEAQEQHELTLSNEEFLAELTKPLDFKFIFEFISQTPHPVKLLGFIDAAHQHACREIEQHFKNLLHAWSERSEPTLQEICKTIIKIIQQREKNQILQKTKPETSQSPSQSPSQLPILQLPIDFMYEFLLNRHDSSKIKQLLEPLVQSSNQEIFQLKRELAQKILTFLHREKYIDNEITTHNLIMTLIKHTLLINSRAQDHKINKKNPEFNDNRRFLLELLRKDAIQVGELYHPKNNNKIKTYIIVLSEEIMTNILAFQNEAPKLIHFLKEQCNTTHKTIQEWETEKKKELERCYPWSTKAFNYLYNHSLPGYIGNLSSEAARPIIHYFANTSFAEKLTSMSKTVLGEKNFNKLSPYVTEENAVTAVKVTTSLATLYFSGAFSVTEQASGTTVSTLGKVASSLSTFFYSTTQFIATTAISDFLFTYSNPVIDHATASFAPIIFGAQMNDPNVLKDRIKDGKQPLDKYRNFSIRMLIRDCANKMTSLACKISPSSSSCYRFTILSMGIGKYYMYSAPQYLVSAPLGIMMGYLTTKGLPVLIPALQISRKLQKNKVDTHRNTGNNEHIYIQAGKLLVLALTNVISCYFVERKTTQILTNLLKRLELREKIDLAAIQKLFSEEFQCDSPRAQFQSFAPTSQKSLGLWFSHDNPMTIVCRLKSDSPLNTPASTPIPVPPSISREFPGLHFSGDNPMAIALSHRYSSPKDSILEFNCQISSEATTPIIYCEKPKIIAADTVEVTTITHAKRVYP